MKIELNEKDCALIFREGVEEPEVYMPKELNVDETATSGQLFSSMIGVLIAKKDIDFVNLIFKKLEELR